MRPKLFPMVLAALAALPGLPAVAQTVPASQTQESAVEDPVARWQADPTTEFSGAEVDLAAFQWVARPVIVFANSDADPAFQDQMTLLRARPEALVERDIVVITDTDPANPSEVRRKLRPRGFMLALLGKDGDIKLRKPLPWDVRELTRVIDKMPMRQREMNQRPLHD
ncbi:DUF4174 domain-containing protein [Oceaniglobus roseus]|uniref:DUF4174 domain-containing protein n=1 Tax=Oceaniglobus roseus TaxID=1737570 RepID=UPI000C7F2C67|nr:DUF4174 domain-containing protein [Kandeliimicrobium roseum]